MIQVNRVIRRELRLATKGLEQRLEAVTVEKNTLERRVAALTQEKLALRLGLEAALSYVDRFLEGRAPEGWTRAESQEIEGLRSLAQGVTNSQKEKK